MATLAKSRKIIRYLSVLLVAGCVATGVEGLHDAHKKQDVAAVGAFAVETGTQNKSNIRREAVKLLADYPIADALPFLEQSATDSNSRVRAETAKTLGSFDSRDAMPLLTGLLGDKSNKVNAAAIRGMAGKVDANDTAQIDALRTNLKSDSVDLRLATAELFARSGLDFGRSETIQTLGASYYTDVRAAIQTLKYFKNEEDVGYLKKFLIAKDAKTQKLAIESIEYILGGTLSPDQLADLKTSATELSTALKTGERKDTLREKPTIYVAFPRGAEEVAERDIDFIGYVSSHNRTENIEVLVNNKPVAVDSLWTDFSVRTRGLRGYPVRWRIPVSVGANRIDVNVLDQAGFLVNHSVTVKRVELVEKKRPKSQAPKAVGDLPARMEDLQLAQPNEKVTADNFMAVLGGWVKQTAKTDYNKGNSMLDQKRYERAAYYYSKSLKTDPSAATYFNLGVVHLALDKKTEARASFQKSCDLKEERACPLAAGQGA